jgi:hypothetical protein
VRALALLITLQVATGCAHYKLIDDGELNERALRKMERETAYARGLPFKRPVRGEVLHAEEVEAYFEKRFSGSDAWYDLQTKVAHKLGILPGHVHLRDLYKKSYAKNAAALYERKDGGRMLLFPDAFPGLVRLPLEVINYATATDWLDELVVSHELVHALQDQHFDLNKVLPGSLYAENEDAALAHKSIVESEANLISYAYAFRFDMDSWAQRNLLVEYLLGTSWMTVGLALLANRRSPSFYTKILTLQYFHGMRFLQQTANRGGGFDAVTRAYLAGLPESTEQVLWPEKFTSAGYDPPIKLAPLAGDALSTWTMLDDNTFGELSLRTLLELHMGGGEARRTARGWGGDRWSVHERDGRVLLVWRTLWDDDQEAAEFERAYREVLKGKYPDRVARRVIERGAKPRGEPRGAWQLWRVSPSVVDGEVVARGVPTTKPELVALRREGDRVLVLEGLAPDDWLAVAEDAWAATRPGTGARAAPRLDVQARQPPLRRPDRGLERAFLAGHHELEARFGVGWRPDGPERTSRETHFRWGFRPHLEVSLPLSLSASGRAGPLLGVVSIGTPTFSGRGPFGVSGTGAFLVDGWLGVAAQVRAEGDIVPGLTPVPGALFLTTAGALYLRAWDRVLLAGGVAWERAGLTADPTFTPIDTLVLGAVTTRGFVDQPTIELRLVDGLHAYGATRVVFSRGGALLDQRHTLGLLLYF